MVSKTSTKNIDKIVAEHSRLSRISGAALADEQLSKLQVLVSLHYNNNAVYRNMLDARGVRPEHIKSLKDIELLPIITTGDILSNGDEFINDMDNVRTFLHTSGSTGESKVIPVHHGEESRRIAENVALGFYITGIKGAGTTYCTFPCGPWPSAFFAHNGAELLGPTDKADMSLPIEWHAKNIARLKPKYFMSSPSYVSFFAREIAKIIDPKDIGLDLIMLAGEPFGEPFRERIQNIFGTKVMDLYGCAEISAASMECPALHASGRHHILGQEMIMETRKIGSDDTILPSGEQGEMIVTPLFKNSMPLIRYAMGDIITLYDHEDPEGRCDCGLNLPMMSRIEGRVDDMLTYGGANLYPGMLFKVMGDMGYDDKFRAVLTKDDDGLMDRLTIHVELPEGAEKPLNGSVPKGVEERLRGLSGELDYVFSRNLVRPIEIEFHGCGNLYKQTGKFSRFVDSR